MNIYQRELISEYLSIGLTNQFALSTDKLSLIIAIKSEKIPKMESRSKLIMVPVELQLNKRNRENYTSQLLQK